MDLWLVLFLLLHRQKYAGLAFESVYLTLMKFSVVSARDRTGTEHGAFCWCVLILPSSMQLRSFALDKGYESSETSECQQAQENTPVLNW